MSASRNHTFNFLEIQRPLKITLRGIFIRGDMLKRDGNRGISKRIHYGSNLRIVEPPKVFGVGGRGAVGWGSSSATPDGEDKGNPKLSRARAASGHSIYINIFLLKISRFIIISLSFIFHYAFLRAYTYIHSRSE